MQFFETINGQTAKAHQFPVGFHISVQPCHSLNPSLKNLIIRSTRSVSQSVQVRDEAFLFQNEEQQMPIL
jgi:hypothetical protein